MEAEAKAEEEAETKEEAEKPITSTSEINGVKVTVSGDAAFIHKDTRLSVKSITVTANSGTKVYTGSEQKVEGYQTPVGLLGNHELSGIEASGSGTNAESYPVTFTGTPVIMDGEVNVTENYKVTLIDGNLFILKSELKITKSADKEGFSEVGEEITYTYVITNTGNVTINGPFTLEDDKIEDEDIDLSGIPDTLAPGGTFTVTAVYKVTQADMSARKVTNVVKVTGTVGDKELSDEDTVTVDRYRPTTPVDPEEPEDPEEPIKPIDPEKPKKPMDPVDKKDHIVPNKLMDSKDKKTEKLVQTGTDINLLIPIGFIIILLGIAYILRERRIRR